jgi:hypothetical protein
LPFLFLLCNPVRKQFIKRGVQLEKITMSSSELLNDSVSTARRYFREAVEYIETQFGKGYAEKHPELIVGFMQTASQEFNTSIMAKCVQDLNESVDDISRTLADKL